MATDRSLVVLLRALQNTSNDQEASRLLSSAATLLTLLSNPLNVTLLTAQILSAPGLWQNHNGLRTPFRILSVFNTASIHILQNESVPSAHGPYPVREGLVKEEWIRAVVKGVDDRSPRWRHMLILGGLLLGFESQGRQGLPPALRRTLEGAIVKATNLALQEIEPGNELAANSIVVVLGHVFDILEAFERQQIRHDMLLPLLVRGSYFSQDGLNWGYFLGMLDVDVVQSADNRFTWDSKSASFNQVQRLASGPLIAFLSSLSQLAAFCVENVKNVDMLLVLTEDLSAFCRSLCVQWRQNKLSEIDITDEKECLSEEALRTSLPLLWQVLKSTMFATVIILRSILGRVLGDRKIPHDQIPFIAIQILHILRNLYFISSRLGHNAFSQYSFVYLTVIDILSRYAVQAEAFLRDIRPAEFGRIPPHPLDRCHDLFFLNTAEHFTLLFSPMVNDELLIGAATPYLSPGSDSRLSEIFEAAHSVMLAVLAAPQNNELIERYLPFYVDALFKVFPQNLSSHQFRIAVRTLVSITAPPSLIAERQSLLSSTLLELVYARIGSACTTPLPSPPTQTRDHIGPTLSEQNTMVLTLIDCLLDVPVDVLEEWLSLTADSLSLVRDQEMLHGCQQRFWDVLSNGEMDVARAAICLAWWNTRQGREKVLFGGSNKDRGPFMSGGLSLDGRSKL